MPTRAKPKIYRYKEHRINANSIDRDALKILHRLKRHNFKAYLVGGGVRDLLLKKVPKDFDIATDARPKQIKNLFRNSRIIGKRFKLAHIYFKNNKIIEVATFRDESQIKKGDAKSNLIQRDNIFGDEASDAIRRDLTINGLFFDISDNTIIDYVDGYKDIKNQVTKVIGKPKLRYEEDPVRMIRVIRHACRANFGIEEKSALAIRSNHSLLPNCPQVRLYEELKKDLDSGHSCEILSLFSEYKLLQYLLPEIEKNIFQSKEKKELFQKYLGRVDALKRKKSISLTSVFALLILINKFNKINLKELKKEFEDFESTHSFTKKTLKDVSIPKKEREKIALIILALVNEKIRNRLNKENKINLAQLYKFITGRTFK